VKAAAVARCAWVAIAALLLAGCVTLSKPAPRIQQFRLDYTAAAPVGTPLPVVMRVLPMEVAPAYDRDAIVYRQRDYQVGSYFYYRWASNPGDMIADLLARDMAASGLYRDVQTAVSIVRPDYQLKGTVEEIEETINVSCAAHLAIRLTLAATRGPVDDRILFSRLYAADEPCACNDATAVAAAMSQALARISAGVQSDVYRAIAAAGH